VLRRDLPPRMREGDVTVERRSVTGFSVESDDVAMTATVVVGAPFKRPDAWRVLTAFLSGLDRCDVGYTMTRTRERIFTTDQDSGLKAGSGAVMWSMQIHDRESFRLMREFVTLAIVGFEELAAQARGEVES